MGGEAGGGENSDMSKGHGLYQLHALPLSPRKLHSDELWYAPHKTLTKGGTVVPPASSCRQQPGGGPPGHIHLQLVAGIPGRGRGQGI